MKGITSNDITGIVILVEIKGKVYQVLTTKDNTSAYLDFIKLVEGNVKCLETPIEGVEMA